jgi:hypothetical protein
VTGQTSPLSPRHIVGVTLAEKSGVKRIRNRYLRAFVLFTAPISCHAHAKSAYVSQGLWRRLPRLGGGRLTVEL